jgi:hypothetical protein
MSLHAQVAVMPPAVFIDKYTRSAEMFVANTGKETQEVMVELEYGYPAPDSLGNIAMQYGDSLSDKKYSLAEKLAIFPKKFELKPGERQTVRFLLRGSGNMEDGFYWSRVRTTGMKAAAQIDSANAEGDVKVGINLAFSMVTFIGYKKGETNAELDLVYLAVGTDSANTNLMLSYQRKGNSPLLSKTKVEIYDANGDLVAAKEEPRPYYFDGKMKFTFPKSDLPAGNYKAKFSFNNDLEDIPKEHRATFQPFDKTFDINVKEKSLVSQ